ncbi:MAG: rod shape-determining protein MreC [Candidatus Promineifilaceae bacterium]
MNDAPYRIRSLTFVVLMGVILVLLVLDSSGNLEGAMNFLADPLAAVSGWVTARAEPLLERVAGPADLETALAYIEQLEERNAALERENEALREDQGELALFQQLFDHAQASPQFTRQAAAVIGYDTSPFFRSIIIDKGSADGVQVGMPVENARGLVGQVYRTSARAAMVLLITDNISSIPARLSESRATGILRGGGLGSSMSMEWIELEAQVAAGEVVMTSGLAGKLPQDLVIGRVVTVERNQAELFQRAIVQPVVDFDELEVVFVITEFRAIDTAIFESIQQEFPGSP